MIDRPSLQFFGCTQHDEKVTGLSAAGMDKRGYCSRLVAVRWYKNVNSPDHIAAACGSF
jgi:hypothetical protein